MAFIIIITIAMYAILIAWTWHSLGFIEKNKKVVLIIGGIILIGIITLIVFQMTQNGIAYENVEMKNTVKNMIVPIFTAVNGIIVMPQIGKILDKINEDEIKQEQLKKRVIIILVVFLLCLIFEIGYMKDVQEGILKMYHAMG